MSTDRRSNARNSVSFLGAELTRWDPLSELTGGPPEALALPFFSDERPLRGAAGLVDWRLCGRISRLLVTQKVAGEMGEATLLPAFRLPFDKLLMFGLGPAESFNDDRFREAAIGLRRALASMQVVRYALSLPGRSTGRIMARRALELWLEASEADEVDPPVREVWLIEPQSAQKEMSEALGRRGL